MKPVRHIAKVLLAALALTLAACGQPPPATDMKNPASVAEAFVRAYNAKDLEAMLKVSGDPFHASVEDTIKAGPDSELHKMAFHPTVMENIAAAKGKVEGPRYENGDVLFKIADAPRDEVYVVFLKQAADGNWAIIKQGVRYKDEFANLPTDPSAAAPAPVAPADEPLAPVEPPRPLRSITSEAIAALAPPYPEAAALGAGNGSPEEAVPLEDRQTAESIDPGMLRRATDYPAYIVQLEFCGQDGAWLLEDFRSRLAARKITGDNEKLFLAILSSASAWHNAAFRARDAEFPNDLALGTCPRATREEFARFVETNWEGKAD